MQPMLPLGLTRWDMLPTPKVRRPGLNSPFRWAYSYTGFSLDFATATLKALGAREGSSILDPFLGSGTTLVAAAALKSGGLGVEINPFSALLARNRLSSRVDSGKITSALSTRSLARPHESSEVLGDENSAYVSRVIDDLCKSYRVKPPELWDRIFADTEGQYDDDAVVLLSLALGARESSRLVRGSNPVWLRPPSENERSNRIELRRSALYWADRICSDLDANPSGSQRKCRIVIEDIARGTWFDQKFDFCLTSPPYLNRLDYVTASLPELTVLQFVKPFSLEQLRRSTIGTTKVISKAAQVGPADLVPMAFNTLQTIRKHPSYASERYYYHIFAEYFVALLGALKRIASSMHRSGKGIIVLQDSFYKDLHIPTPSICVEMLESLSCEARIVAARPVRTHMGRMNPRQNAYVAQKILTESLIYFSVA